MSLAFGFGRARVVRRLGKGMSTLHASAVRLPGPGARRVHRCGQSSPGGRQTEANLSGPGKKTRERGRRFARVRHPSVHPSIHSFIQQIFIWHIVPSSVLGEVSSVREGTDPSLDHPGELPGRDRVLGDEGKLAWETRRGREFQRERGHVQELACH